MIRTRIANARYELGKVRERAALWLVWHAPRRFVYWSAIRLGAEATTGPHSGQVVPELTFLDALKRWDAA